MNIIEQIIKDKKQSIPSDKEFFNKDIIPTEKDFTSALKKNTPQDKISLIAEIKRKSPSKREIRLGLTVKQALEWYEPYASAISVLTEENYFGGCITDLEKANSLTNKPLLRKDFITELVQIKEARFYKADAYLLIASVLSRNQLIELIEAGLEYNMPALVEVHSIDELEIVLQTPAKIIGVNNRNLKDLSIDLNQTSKIIKYIPQEIKNKIVIISESGIQNKNDLIKVQSHADAVLIGTAFMKEKNPSVLLKNMFGKL